jgi:signal transduction histidine kinase
VNGNREPRNRVARRVGWLVLLVVLIARQVDGRPAQLALLGVVAVAWSAWIVAQWRGRRDVVLVALLVLGAGGGVLSFYASIGIAVFAAVSIAAASGFDLAAAAAIAGVGPVTLAIATLVGGGRTATVAGGAAVALAGFIGGLSRRQAEERARAHAELAAANERTALAREVHDVLAHTLGAVSMQLEALDALLESNTDGERLRSTLARARGLVHEGIDETHAAVRALRDDPVQLDERVRELVAGTSITLAVVGAPRPLPPAAGIGLLRAAQEAITNVGKHAPGAAAAITIVYDEAETVLTVTNPTPTAPTAERTLGGYGLQGMRERIELAGGRVTAAPSDDGWTVQATVPA